MKLLLAALLALTCTAASAHGHHHHHGKHHWHTIGKKPDGLKSSRSNASAATTPFSIPMFDAQDAARLASVVTNRGSSILGSKAKIELFREYEDWKRFLRERELNAIFKELKFGDAFAAAGGKP